MFIKYVNSYLPFYHPIVSPCLEGTINHLLSASLHLSILDISLNIILVHLPFSFPCSTSLSLLLFHPCCSRCIKSFCLIVCPIGIPRFIPLFMYGHFSHFNFGNIINRLVCAFANSTCGYMFLIFICIDPGIEE